MTIKPLDHDTIQVSIHWAKIIAWSAVVGLAVGVFIAGVIVFIAGVIVPAMFVTRYLGG